MRAHVRRYSAREVANALGLHIRTVERACNRGELPSYRTPSGHYLLIEEPALDYWLTTGNARRILSRSLSRSPRSANSPSQPPNQAKPGNDTNKP
jgi:excisionase family DNA binding protein